MFGCLVVPVDLRVVERRAKDGLSCRKRGRGFRIAVVLVAVLRCGCGLIAGAPTGVATVELPVQPVGRLDSVACNPVRVAVISVRIAGVVEAALAALGVAAVPVVLNAVVAAVSVAVGSVFLGAGRGFAEGS